jgi:methyl-accepting chemotaxis protein
MFEKLKLRDRILLSYSGPIALSILVAIGVFGAVTDVARKSDLVQAANDIIFDVESVGYYVSNLQKSVRGFMLARSDETLRQYDDAIKASNASLKSLESSVANEEQRKVLVEIKDLVGKAQAYNDNLLNLSKSGKVADAIAIWKETQGKIGVELDKVLQDFIEKETAILAERRASRQASLNFLVGIVIVGALISAVGSLILGYLISVAISKQVKDAASLVGSSSAEIAATLEQQDRTTSQQATSVNETTTTVEELGASSRQSAEQADASAAGAKEALAITENGLRSVEQTTTGLNNLKESVRGIAEQIMRLSEQTGQISGVTAVVADIANQTNMLALNAAVEAARAGEQGKGFAVVASEIRKLADESKKSAERIYQLVSDVQAAMNSTVMVTDEGTKTANSSIQLAQGTAEAFNSVAEAVNSVFLNNQQIALSSKQQAVAVQQIVSAMNAINLGAKETSAGIAQVKTATNQVNAAAKNLVALT